MTFVEPNGIAFSPDEKKLYVIDTGFTDGPDNVASHCSDQIANVVRDRRAAGRPCDFQRQ
jgi:DNA-binding beta-propeller fold protein YncE